MTEQREELARRASSFGSQAAAYAEYRPDYPAALFEWGLSAVRDAPDLRVLDMGAGTGKLTQGLLALGVDVVAVEPDPAMLAQLRRLFPGVDARLAAAEDIPLPDSSVNAVFVGQALHWFDLDLALSEFGRVLRPGGSLVAAWNGYDASVPWVAEFTAITDSASTRDGADEVIARLSRFGTVEKTELPHSTVRTVDSLVNVVGTQSQWLVAEPAERDERLGELRRYLEANPITAHGEFVVPMLTLALKVTPP
jgi:SAM-dependent methyltransferase